MGNPSVVQFMYRIYFSVSASRTGTLRRCRAHTSTIDCISIRKSSRTRIGGIRAQTAFSRKTRIYPHTLADQSLQGAQIAAQTHPNRRI
jgi:hypothetical protein